MRLAFALVVAAIMLGPLHALRAQLPPVHILSLSTDAAAGHDSNRHQDATETSSAFLEAAPQVTYIHLFGEAAELNLYATGLYREFLASGLTFEDHVQAGGHVSTLIGRIQTSADLAAGRFRNHDDPWDDYAWVSFRPDVQRRFAQRWTWSLHGIVAYEAYDSRTTLSGKQEDAVRWGIVPGIRLELTPAVAVWGALMGERFDPNEPLDAYQEYGLRGGLRWSMNTKLHTGAVLETSRQNHDETGGHRTTLYHGELWARYRVTPQIGLHAALRGWTSNSSLDVFDYDRWVGSVGVAYTAEVKLNQR